MNWKNWCRLCATEDEIQSDIFVKNENFTNISEMLIKHFSFPLFNDDEYPNKICSSCNNFVLSVAMFSEKIIKVNQMYLEIDNLIKVGASPDFTLVRKKYLLELDNYPIEKLEEKRNLRKKKEEIKKEDKTATNSFSENFLGKIDEVLTESKDYLEDDIEKISVKSESLESNDEKHDFEEYLSEECDDQNDVDYNPILKNNEEVDNDSPKEQTKSKRVRKTIKNETKKIRKKYGDEDKSIKCEYCPMKFVRENNLSSHLKKVHNIVKELPPCEFCGKICKTKQKLRFHRELHLPLEEREKLLFKCPLCEQKFTQKGAMRSHIRGTHSKERPFICEACGQSFTSQSNLWAHRRKTHEIEMLPCEICQKICKNTLSLRKHMASHKEPSIPCSVCGILLKTKKTLKNHMLVHSDVKAYQCNYCGKEFKRDITLQLHMIIHSGLKPYVCRFCDQTYANPSNCKKHEKHSHPTEYQEMEIANGPNQPQRLISKLPNLKQLHNMLEDMKASKSKV